MLLRVTLLLVVMLVSACTGLPEAPIRAKGGSEFAYQIGPGDKIRIDVWRNPDLSATVTVSPDGKITSPLVENLQAAGKRPENLAREVEANLRKYIRDPTVTIRVVDFVDSRNQVRVVGQAAKPAAIPFRQGMTLLDIMIKAGGLTEFAAGNRAVLIRQETTTAGTKTRQYNVRLRDLLKGGDVSANIEVLPGDVIMIPEGAF